MDNKEKDFIMLPKVDFAFKELMTNEKVRRGFLSAVLGIDVNEIKKTELKNTNLPKHHDDEKQCILDVRIVMNDDTEINAEMQVAAMATWTDRSTFYASKIVSEQVDVDKKYTNIKKCISISIVNFNCVKQTKRYHTVYHIREDSEPEIIFSDKMEWHLIELPKLPTNTDGTSVYDWAKFFKSENREEFEMLAKKDEYLREAYTQLDIMSHDSQKRMEYEARKKALYDLNTMIEEGETRGMLEGKKMIIRSFYEGGMTAEMISGYTKIPVEEILKIVNSDK